MKAIGENVFILPDWDNEEKHGEIFLPKVRQRDLPDTGVVVAMPLDKADAEFCVGSKVVYDKHKQQLTDVPGEKLTLALVKIKDVIAVYL